MKRIILLFAAAACSLISAVTVSAQIAVRADVGPAGYTTTYMADSPGSIAFGIGARVGADYDFHVKGSFYVTPGLNWSYRLAVENTDDQITATEKLQEHFLNVPVYAKWKFDIKPDKFGMYVYVGPAFSFGLSSKSMIDMMGSLYALDGTYDYFSGKADFGSRFNDELQKELDLVGLKYSRFEVRLEWGVGFVINGHSELVLGCDLGLTNKLKGENWKNYYMTGSTAFIGYRFRFGKM